MDRPLPALSPAQPGAGVHVDEAFYRHLVEHSLGLICAHDLAGKLLIVNGAAADSLGYTAQELVGRNLADLMPDAARPRFSTYIGRIRRHGRARGYLDLRTRSGETVTWVYRNLVYEKDGEPWVIGHAQDVTWRLRLERKFRESNERFRLLFEEAPVAYHEIDSEGVIVRVNRAECQLLGYARESLIGRPVWDFVAPERRDDSVRSVRAKLSGALPLSPFFRDYVRADGERLTLHIHENLIFDHDGAICGVRSTLLDVTEQVRTQSQLRRMNVELDRRVAQQTAELRHSTERLKEFIYTVSHDLQEPLRSISSFAGLLQTRYSSKLDAAGVEFLAYVISGAARMSTLIRDLLAYSRVIHDDELELELVDSGEMLAIAEQNLSLSIEQSGAAITHGELPRLRANPGRLIQLFQNLLSNAIRHRSEAPPVVHVSAESTAWGWEFAVSDNGSGVRTRDRERIFGLFKRGMGATPNGSGAGLAICQAIVERHGGRIWVEPNEGGGSVFRFTLATSGAAAAQSA